jgi:hypothetical protein
MTLIVLSVLVAAAFLAAGAVKIRMIPIMFATARRLGVPFRQMRLIGVLEVIFAVVTFLGIWVDWLGSIGTLVLTLIAAGAIIAHARVADAPKEVIAPVALGTLAFIVFLMHLYQ